MIPIDHSKKFSDFFEKKTEPRKVGFLVLHHIEANSVEHAIRQLCEHQVSSHFLIDELGKIFELVAENDVAWHAGVSHWRGVEGLNQTSIGIEFINSSPFTKKFEMVQMQSGLSLCQYLIRKYQIKPGDVVGHSDIAYDKETGLPDRKQDPSHLFDWKFLAMSGVGIFPDFSLTILRDFRRGDCDPKIAEVKKNLRDFGYRVMNMNDEFDLELSALATVFSRRFGQ
ncbi:MAG: N-acetylmuramoyl-L-alanine amidase [Alphaproteobacteria bacterium]|nr:N-acetylmuramoyl-L-alanine amidase [Alphaproteobacteria bacterium]